MKMRRGWFLGFVCLFLCAGAASAEESTPETAGQCPQAAVLEQQVKAKRNEIMAVEGRIKVLRREQKAQKEAERVKKQGERQARLEGLKLTDPQKYEKEMAKQFKLQKERDTARKQKVQERGNRPKLTHEQWLEQIKTKNPHMYDLVIKKDTFEDEVKVLRGQIQDARKACMSKK